MIQPSLKTIEFFQGDVLTSAKPTDEHRIRQSGTSDAAIGNALGSLAPIDLGEDRGAGCLGVRGYCVRHAREHD